MSPCIFFLALLLSRPRQATIMVSMRKRDTGLAVIALVVFVTAGISCVDAATPPRRALQFGGIQPQPITAPPSTTEPPPSSEPLGGAEDPNKVWFREAAPGIAGREHPNIKGISAFGEKTMRTLHGASKA